ncbi:hypothetical protein GCM10009555_107550 [Acrocarpospora macrocephala]|uniref:Uncharacterized protein n=1 Tax=Acrocarpospora macrocephala TaxID=150177 RepID=A0A5M3X6S9_9ACTN|nr:hypothetical protein [Acrocarpospora macrocephala]GES16770.1 hypothetical protein Amac_103680 [Acrocarpospora macrocephala]
MTFDEVFPVDKLNALRLGRLLVAEVKASRPECRAWVAIHPLRIDVDRAAQREGWTRSDARRSFRLTHREFLTEHLDGWDYDVGSSEIKRTVATDEADLLAQLRAWGVPPEHLTYPWNTDYPA